MESGGSSGDGGGSEGHDHNGGHDHDGYDGHNGYDGHDGGHDGHGHMGHNDHGGDNGHHDAHDVHSDHTENRDRETTVLPVGKTLPISGPLPSHSDEGAQKHAVQKELKDMSKPDTHTTHTVLNPAFTQKEYTFDKNPLTLVGSKLSAKNSEGKPLLFAEEKPFRLKGQYTIFGDKEKKQPLLTIKAQNIVDEGATFVIIDPASDKSIGGVKRNMFKSNFRTDWTILSAEKKAIGRITEKSKKRAIFARLLGSFVKREYLVTGSDDTQIAQIHERKNPFSWKMDMKIIKDDPAIDKRVLVASGILLANIDGRGGKTK